jgi:hypothetical protein
MHPQAGGRLVEDGAVSTRSPCLRNMRDLRLSPAA